MSRLRAGRELLHGDLALSKLVVAEQDHESRAVFGGELELRAEAALFERRHYAEPPAAQAARDLFSLATKRKLGQRHENIHVRTEIRQELVRLEKVTQRHVAHSQT